MGTIADYIQWRGDLEFWQDGFNVIDNLFSLFEATGALTLTELKKSGLKGLQALSKKSRRAGK